MRLSLSLHPQPATERLRADSYHGSVQLAILPVYCLGNAYGSV